MADEQTDSRLLVRIEVAQAKVEKQMAAIAKSGADSATNIERSFKKSSTGVVQSVGAQRAAVANLSFQLNDIAMGLASGTSPFTIMVQQGSQVSQALQGSGGLIGAVKTLGGAFATMVNPVSLASFALIGLGGAAIQWLTSTRDQIPGVDKLLENHAKLIGDIQKAYGGAKQASSDYTETARGNIDKQITDQADQMEKARKAAQQKILQATQVNTPTVFAADFSTQEDVATLPERFKAFKDAIAQLNAEIAKGNPDYERFYKSIREIAAGDNTGGLQKIRAELVGIVADDANLAQAQRERTGLISDQETAYGQLGAAIKAIDSSEARSELDKMEQKARDGEISISDVEKSLLALSASNPDMSGPLASLKALFDAAIKTNEAIVNINREGMGGRVGNGLGTVEFGNRFGGDNSVNNQLQKQKDDIQKQLDKEARANRPKKEREDDLERFTRRIQEQTLATQQAVDAQAQLNPLIDDYGYAAEAARLYQEGLNAAKKAEIDLTPAQLAALKTQTEGLAAVRAEQERLQEQQGKIKQSFEDWNNTAKSSIGGLISDFINGESAAQSFANALKKIADQLIQVGLNGLFDSKSGIGSSLLSFLGIGGSSFAGGGSSSYFPPAPSYAIGTNNHPGGAAWVGEQGPELVNLPKGSKVIPNAPSMKSLGQGQSINVSYNPVIDNRGASVEAVARLEQALAKQQREFGARVVQTVRTAQKTRNL